MAVPIKKGLLINQFYFLLDFILFIQYRQKVDIVNIVNDLICFIEKIAKNWNHARQTFKSQ